MSNISIVHLDVGIAKLTFISPLYSVVARRPLWHDMVEMGRGMRKPWLCIGDFNAYLKLTDKVGGPQVTGYMVRGFEDYCVQTGLSDLSSIGFHFTWSNGSIWCKLDRMWVNQEWLGAPFDTSAEVLAIGANSDHSPCVVTFKERGANPFRPFRYYNMWSNHLEFQGIVRDVWFEEICGTKQFVTSRKLKLIKQPFRRLNNRAFGHISERAERARGELEDAQKQLHEIPDSEQARLRVTQAKTQVAFLDKAERSCIPSAN